MEWSEVKGYIQPTEGSHLWGSCCLPLAASAGLFRAPSVYSRDVLNLSGALIFLPGFSKVFFLSSVSSIRESTELWLLLLLLRDRTLPFPLPDSRLQGGDGKLKGLEPVLLRPDGNVIDSNYTRDLNGHVTGCDKTSNVTFLRRLILGSDSGC